MRRLVVALYIISVALLPWMWFPAFPWLHKHAQWSDAVFAVTAVLWAIDHRREGSWPRLRPVHLALGLYFILACLSLLFATPDPGLHASKLLGVAELCVLVLITSDLASRPGVFPRIAKAVALTTMLTGAAVAAGLVLFYCGIQSRLIGIYGELDPSPWYARVQAGTYNPNLLASFCIFAAAVVAGPKAKLSVWFRRTTLAVLWVTVLLTFSRGILGFVLAAVIRNAVTPRRRIAAAIGAASLVAVTLSMTLWRPVINPLRPFEARFENVSSSRFEAATTSLKTIVSHPILGSGLGTNPGLYRGVPFDSHLTPVNIAATLGLPALSALSFLVVLIWRRRDRPTELAIWGGLAGLALDGLAQDVEDFRHVWVLLGLAGSHTIETSDDDRIGT